VGGDVQRAARSRSKSLVNAGSISVKLVDQGKKGTLVVTHASRVRRVKRRTPKRLEEQPKVGGEVWEQPQSRWRPCH